jgi:hypothetical protein
VLQISLARRITAKSNQCHGTKTNQKFHLPVGGTQYGDRQINAAFTYTQVQNVPQY